MRKKLVKRILRVDPKWTDFIDQSLSANLHPTFWSAWNDDAGRKIKFHTLCSFKIPGQDLFYGQVQYFVLVESVGYVVVYMGKIMQQTKLIDCPCIEIIPQSQLLPLYQYNNVEQGWVQANGTIIINKYAHY